MNDIVETLWQKLYTTGYQCDYAAVQNYCYDNGFVYYPEHAMTDNYAEEERRQLFAWLEKHLAELGDVATIEFFRNFMNTEV